MIERLDIPLEVFIIVNLINDFMLLVDYALILLGQTSITRMATEYPVVGFVVILFQCIAPVAMYLHFK